MLMMVDGWVKKGDADKAGKILKTSEQESPEFINALNIANQWRLQHLDPLFTLFQLVCEVMNKQNINALCSIRLKRLQSIINKLKRPTGHFKLGEIDDIGGCRIIVDDIHQIELLQQELCSVLKSKEIAIKVKDYVFSPSKQDGYRSVHLLVRIPNGTRTEDGTTRLEIQIRTVKQHLWATTIETLGSLYSTDYKSPVSTTADKEERTVRQYFALVSNLIAIAEKCPTIPKYPSDLNENLNELKRLDTQLKKDFERDIKTDLEQASKGIFKLPQMSFAKVGEKYIFYLFRVNTSQQVISIDHLVKNNLSENARVYFQNEESFMEQHDDSSVMSWQDVVLVATSDRNKLQLAYPSYFLDTSEFITMLEQFTNDIL